MPNNKNDSQNTIKYSIWETKTEKSHIPYIDNSPESKNKHYAERNRRDS